MFLLALAILVGVGLALWTLYSFVRFGFEGRPRSDPGDRGEGITESGEGITESGEDRLGFTGCFGVVVLVGAIFLIAAAVWAAFGN